MGDCIRIGSHSGVSVCNPALFDRHRRIYDRPGYQLRTARVAAPRNGCAAALQGESSADFGIGTADCFYFSIFITFQRYFTKGITMGDVKEEGDNMIYAKNEKAATYLGISQRLDAALKCLTPEFLNGLQDKAEIIPGEVWVIRNNYTTVPDAESFHEAHEKYLDIHALISGTERIEVTDVCDLTMSKAVPENDFFVYEGQGRRTLVLTPGDFVVLWPGEAHKLKMVVDGPSQVVKAVFKIKA